MKKTATPFEISQAYGIPEGTLANMRHKGVGPLYYRVGRRILYFNEDVESWIKKNPVPTRDCAKEEDAQL